MTAIIHNFYEVIPRDIKLLVVGIMITEKTKQ